MMTMRNMLRLCLVLGLLGTDAFVVNNAHRRVKGATKGTTCLHAVKKKAPKAEVETLRKKQIVASVREKTDWSEAEATKAVDAVLTSIQEVSSWIFF